LVCWLELEHMLLSYIAFIFGKVSE